MLLFMCCHPALTAPSAIALTLRAVGGLTTAEIARAFLVPEATMAQRISRAKQHIKAAGGRFAMPTDAERTERLGAVMHVLYLIFNEGHTASSGDALNRVDLSSEAIRLTRLLDELLPLDEQDRSLWDRAQIAEGTALVERALASGSVGSYAAQAAIAAIHDEAPSTDATDWRQILGFFDLLNEMSDNPMIALNRAVAAAMVHGPAHGLALLDELAADERIRGHYRIDAVRGHLLERTGDRDGALRHFAAAAERTTSTPEQNYLRTKVARLAAR